MSIVDIIASVLVIWVVVECVRIHRSFKSREILFYSIIDRIEKGEKIQPHEYEKLSIVDQQTIERLQYAE